MAIIRIADEDAKQLRKYGRSYSTAMKALLNIITIKKDASETSHLKACDKPQ
jgi:hypothetical protein